ncbi:uncharacterized protein I206_100951 [Kwoniella pini CBS 10737]|uniref:Uncharacterized protein n=1 Tax=Kwoniella pini CBS 10737 TaxID=1296096 RepID=A0A1B9ICC1_9TREE|nr:uncharacterized protein I206_00375 [Kwoniella pini CBS 10737]OCF53074.1 hypothetical protein I206_00375 [Kwoniella pini CBS 10737]
MSVPAFDINTPPAIPPESGQNAAPYTPEINWNHDEILTEEQWHQSQHHDQLLTQPPMISPDPNDNFYVPPEDFHPPPYSVVPANTAGNNKQPSVGVSNQQALPPRTDHKDSPEGLQSSSSYHSEPYISYPVHHEEHQYNHLHRPIKVKKYTEKPQVQIVSQATDSRSSSVANSMQMMMMNSMMMQQMQAQQMQSAQMAAINQQNFQMQAQQLQNKAWNNLKSNKAKSSVNIHSHSKQKRYKPRSKVIQAKAIPKIALPPISGMYLELSEMSFELICFLNQAVHQQASIESVALDNWQEATIILCFAAVGLIYLICSRAGGEEKKEDIARKHMS